MGSVDIRSALAELIGTFIFLLIGFLGVTAMFAFTANGGVPEMVNIALAFGLGLFVAIQFAGVVSGGHFNPAGDPHAGPHDAKRHAGDLGNVEANKDGVADVEYVDPVLSFEGPTSVLGRGVIVHAAADDFKTQPTGNAGGRVACGVVGAAKTP